MSRVSFGTARTGKRAGSSGGMLKTLEYKMGEMKRIIFPLYEGELVLFAKPYHSVLNKSVELRKSNGQGTYPVNKIRCMHPFSQTNSTESLKIAKKGEMCLFCDIAKYENRRQWNIINEEFGEDGFKELTKKEKREYFQGLEAEKTVEPSYYKEEDDDGNSETKTLMDIYILALEVQVDKKGKPVMDDEGLPKYEAIVMPASKSRLSKFKTGVDNAIASGTIEEDMLYTYVENEGTDAEEEVMVGYVDFLVNFPQEKEKMTSGRNMTATPVSAEKSVISDEFIESFEKVAEEVVKKADTLINNFYVNLKTHDRESAKEMLVNGEEYFDGLEEEFRLGDPEEEGEPISDDDRDAEIFAKVLENNSGSEEDSDEEEKPKRSKSDKEIKEDKKTKVEDDEGEENEEEEKPKTRKKSDRDKSSKTKGEGKKVKTGKSGKKKPKPVEEEELDEDEFDGDPLFDDE